MIASLPQEVEETRKLLQNYAAELTAYNPGSSTVGSARLGLGAPNNHGEEGASNTFGPMSGPLSRAKTDMLQDHSFANSALQRDHHVTSNEQFRQPLTTPATGEIAPYPSNMASAVSTDPGKVLGSLDSSDSISGCQEAESSRTGHPQTPSLFFPGPMAYAGVDDANTNTVSPCCGPFPGTTTADQYLEAQPFNISFNQFGDVWSNVDPFPEDFMVAHNFDGVGMMDFFNTDASFPNHQL